MYYVFKLIITTILIVLISEIAKRSSLAGAMLAAIPLVSILAMTWMYIDTNSSVKAVEFSKDIVWLIAPTMTFFFTFPFFIQKGFHFYISMGFATILTMFAYYIVLYLVTRLGLR